MSGRKLLSAKERTVKVLFKGRFTARRIWAKMFVNLFNRSRIGQTNLSNIFKRAAVPVKYVQRTILAGNEPDVLKRP